MDNINWYPGHMKKTREMIVENLKLVHTVLEVADARIPISGRNPVINELVGSKDHILLLNKIDLADNKQTDLWLNHFNRQQIPVLTVNGREGQGIKPLIKKLESRNIKRGKTHNKKPYRIMIVGVPNSGKSSLINRLTGMKSTGVGNRPGFTKGKQWITLPNKIQLLDTPGILWPKFEDPQVGLNLAFCGSIKDEILDVSDLALKLIEVLSVKYPERLKTRYKLSALGDTPLNTMDMIAENRGFMRRGGEIDYERTGRIITDEFRSGLMGGITLETVDETK